jgi:hypothetical protein
MQIANLASDINILSQAQNAAEQVLHDDPDLSLPENRKLKEQIERLFELNADKLN